MNPLTQGLLMGEGGQVGGGELVGNQTLRSHPNPPPWLPSLGIPMSP